MLYHAAFNLTAYLTDHKSRFLHDPLLSRASQHSYEVMTMCSHRISLRGLDVFAPCLLRSDTS